MTPLPPGADTAETQGDRHAFAGIYVDASPAPGKLVVGTSDAVGGGVKVFPLNLPPGGDVATFDIVSL